MAKLVSLSSFLIYIRIYHSGTKSSTIKWWNSTSDSWILCHKTAKIRLLVFLYSCILVFLKFSWLPGKFWYNTALCEEGVLGLYKRRLIEGKFDSCTLNAVRWTLLFRRRHFDESIFIETYKNLLFLGGLCGKKLKKIED